jgi:O-acetyl-ADP-ribose deacetylase (regulator of RNase III)
MKHKNLTYVFGSVLSPVTVEGGNFHYIIHCCNAMGIMGSGVARALYEKWPDVKKTYESMYQYSLGDKKNENKVNLDFLGAFHSVRVGYVDEPKNKKPLCVVNMIGQKWIGLSPTGEPPICYHSMSCCMNNISKLMDDETGSIHAPYLMGADRAGGKWEEIEKLLIKHFSNKGIPVYIYDVEDKLGLSKTGGVLEVRSLFDL